MGHSTSAFRELEIKSGYNFRDKNIIEQAMSHSSLRVSDHEKKDYQRLEFLGDSVIQFVITNYLYQKNPNVDAGTLSIARSKLVDQKKQSWIAEKLDLPKHVQMSPGVQVKDFKRYDEFVESLIGAIYMDAGGENGGGYLATKQVIYNLWEL